VVLLICINKIIAAPEQEYKIRILDLCVSFGLLHIFEATCNLYICM
jgi:hypothetical protein